MDQIKPFQQKGIDWLKSKESAILADDMGLGKTVQSLQSRIHDAVNVICPASVKINWAHEVKKWTDLSPIVCKGLGSFSWAELGQVVIANSELITGNEDRSRHALTLILDEVHMYRNNRTQKFYHAQRAISMLAPGSQIIGLTGTPIVNRLTDLINVLDLMGLLTKHFGARQSVASSLGGKAGSRGDMRKCEVNSWFTDKLATIMLRRMKVDVMDELPEKIYQVIMIDEWSGGLNVLMNNGMDSLNAYEAMYGQIEGGSLPTIAELATARKQMAIEKTPHVIKFIEGYEDHQFVVFSAHRYPIEQFSKLNDWGKITGSVSHKKRQDQADAFLKEELSGMALTIGAGNAGLNLQSASEMIFVDLSHKLAENLQAEDRINRIGQKANVLTYRYFVFNHPLDKRMGQILTGKKKLFDSICDPIVVRGK